MYQISQFSTDRVLWRIDWHFAWRLWHRGFLCACSCLRFESTLLWQSRIFKASLALSHRLTVCYHSQILCRKNSSQASLSQSAYLHLHTIPFAVTKGGTRSLTFMKERKSGKSMDRSINKGPKLKRQTVKHSSHSIKAPNRKPRKKGLSSYAIRGTLESASCRRS